MKLLDAIRIATERKKNRPIHRYTANSKKGRQIMSQSSTVDIVKVERQRVMKEFVDEMDDLIRYGTKGKPK